MKKKTKGPIYSFLLLVIFFTIEVGCSKEKAKEIPVVRTSEVVNIKEFSAICGGIVTLEGDAPVFERGICWDTIQEINESNSPHLKNGDGFGEYTCSMFYLRDTTKYYVRAYAINNYGTGYGEIRTFTTLRNANNPLRDNFVGIWQFIESGKSTPIQSYIVTISKDPSDINGVILENFGNPGSGIKATGFVNGNQIDISLQTMSNGWVVSGNGKLSNPSKMNWSYSIKIAGINENFVAIASKQ